MKAFFRKPYAPFLTALVISILLNAFPLIGAFVLNLDGWVEAA